MRRLLMILALLLLAGGAAHAKNNIAECKELKNSAARENCYKHNSSKQSKDTKENKQYNCGNIRDERARRECYDRKDDKHFDCRDIRDDRARRECYEPRSGTDDRRYDCRDIRDDRAQQECYQHRYGNKLPETHRGESRDTAKSFCSAAKSKPEYDQCMIDRGFNP